MARFENSPPTDTVPRPADGLPDQARVPEHDFVPPDEAPGDLPMIPMIPPEQFADRFPAAGEAAEDALEELDFF